MPNCGGQGGGRLWRNCLKFCYITMSCETKKNLAPILGNNPILRIHVIQFLQPHDKYYSRYLLMRTNHLVHARLSVGNAIKRKTSRAKLTNGFYCETTLLSCSRPGSSLEIRSPYVS